MQPATRMSDPSSSIGAISTATDDSGSDRLEHGETAYPGVEDPNQRVTVGSHLMEVQVGR